MALNCSPALLWKRPEAAKYKEYMKLGCIAWSDEPRETIPDSNDEACFRSVGYHAKLGGHKTESPDYVKPSRRVRKAVKHVISATTDEQVKKDLQDSLGYVMPPNSESSIVASLRGQSKKQTVARPSPQVRLLRYINQEVEVNSSSRMGS